MNASMNITIRVAAARAQKEVEFLRMEVRRLEAELARVRGASTGMITGQAMASLGKWGSRLQWAGRQLVANFSLPLIIAGGLITKWALDNEAAMVRVEKVYGDAATGPKEFAEDLGGLTKAFDLLSVKYAESREDVINIAADWAAAGAKGGALARGIEATLKTMTLGEMEAAEATEALIAIQAQYGTDTKGLLTIVDTLNATENTTGVTFAGLVKGMSRSASVARSAGIDVDHLAAMISSLSPAAGSANEAGTSLKTIISRMLSPTSEAREIFKALGIAINEVSWSSLNGAERLEVLASKYMTLGDAGKDLISAQAGIVSTYVASRRQINKFDVLMRDLAYHIDDNAETNGYYTKTLELLADKSAVAKIAQRELNSVLQSNPEAVKRAGVVIQNSLMRVIAQLLPQIVSFINIVAKLFEKFSNLDPAIQKTVIGFFALLAVIGPPLVMVGSMAVAISQVGASMIWTGSMFGKFFGLFGKAAGLISGLTGKIRGYFTAMTTGSTAAVASNEAVAASSVQASATAASAVSGETGLAISAYSAQAAAAGTSYTAQAAAAGTSYTAQAAAATAAYSYMSRVFIVNTEGMILISGAAGPVAGAAFGTGYATGLISTGPVIAAAAAATAATAGTAMAVGLGGALAVAGTVLAVGVEGIFLKATPVFEAAGAEAGMGFFARLWAFIKSLPGKFMNLMRSIGKLFGRGGAAAAEQFTSQALVRVGTGLQSFADIIDVGMLKATEVFQIGGGKAAGGFISRLIAFFRGIPAALGRFASLAVKSTIDLLWKIKPAVMTLGKSVSAGVMALATGVARGLGVAFRAIPLATNSALVSSLRIVGGFAARLVGLFTGPIGWIVTAIVTVVLLFQKQIGQVFKNIGDQMRDVTSPFGQAIQGIVSLWHQGINAIIKSFHALPEGIQSSLRAVVSLVNAAAMKVYELFSYLNPFARHSPSLVENVTNGLAVVGAQFGLVAKVIKRHMLDGYASLAMFGFAVAKFMNKYKATIKATERSSIKKFAGAGALIAYDKLSAMLPPLESDLDNVSKAVDKQKVKVDALSISLQSMQSSAKIVQDVYYQMANALSVLGENLSVAKNKLDGFVSSPIQGMRAMSDAIFDNDIATKRLQLRMLQLGGVGLDDLKGQLASLRGEIDKLSGEQNDLRAAGAGGGVLSAYQDQIDILSAQSDAVSAQSAPLNDMQVQLEALQKAGQVLDLENAIQFDPLTRQVDQLANGYKELPFNEIMDNITSQKSTVDELQTSYDSANISLRDQKTLLDEANASVDAAQVAYDKQNVKLSTLTNTYGGLRTEIDAIKGSIDEVVSAAQAMESALDSSSGSKGRMGGAGNNSTALENFEGAAGGSFPDVGGALTIGDEIGGIDEWLKKFTDGTGDIFSGLDIFGPFREIWKKFKQWWNQNIVAFFVGIGDFFTNAWTDVSTAVAGLLTSVSTGVSTAWATVTDIFTNIGIGIVEAFTKDIDWTEPIDNIVEPILNFFNGDNTVMNAARGWIEAIAAPWSGVWDKIKESFSDAMDRMKEPVARLRESLTEAWDKIKGRLTEAWSKIVEAFDSVKKNLTEAWDKLKQAAKKLKEAFSDAWEKIQPAIEKLREAFDKIWPKIKEAWDKISPILGAIMKGIGYVLGFIGAAIVGIIIIVSNIIANVITPIIDIIMSVVTGAIDIIVGFIDFFISLFTGDFAGAWQAVVDIITGVWDMVYGIIKGAIELVIGIVTGFVEGIVSWFQWLDEVAGGKISEFVVGIWDWFKDLWDTVYGFVKGLVEDVVGFFQKLWTDVTTKVSELVSSVVTFFKELPGKVMTAIGDMLSFLVEKGSDLVNGLFNGIKTVWETVKTWLIDLGVKVLTAIGNTVSTLKQKGVDFLTGLYNGIKEKWTTVTTWFGDLSDKIKNKLGSGINLLKDAGRNIIGGLFSGLKEKFETVKTWFGGIGTWIANNKGPKEYDLKLLVPAGGWIMDGLQNGLVKSIPGLQKTVEGVFNVILSATDGIRSSASQSLTTDTAIAARTMMSAGGTSGQAPVSSTSTGKSTGDTYNNFHGDLSFPNIKNAEDAELFLQNLDDLAGSGKG